MSKQLSSTSSASGMVLKLNGPDRLPRHRLGAPCEPTCRLWPGAAMSRSAHQALTFQIAQPFDLEHAQASPKLKNWRLWAEQMHAYMASTGRIHFALPIRIDPLPNGAALQAAAGAAVEA
jgi:hypothetical protein